MGVCQKLWLQTTQVCCHSTIMLLVHCYLNDILLGDRINHAHHIVTITTIVRHLLDTSKEILKHIANLLCYIVH